jgi:hypothetical protein
MILGIEIATLVMGIIALFKGQIKLSKKRLVKGTPAYIIGIILTCTLPAIMAAGFVIGFLHAMNHPNVPLDPLKFIFLDVGGLAISAILVFIIAALSPNSIDEDQKRNPYARHIDDSLNPQNFPPPNDNPYSSPYADNRDPMK